MLLICPFCCLALLWKVETTNMREQENYLKRSDGNNIYGYVCSLDWRTTIDMSTNADKFLLKKVKLTL